MAIDHKTLDSLNRHALPLGAKAVIGVDGNLRLVALENSAIVLVGEGPGGGECGAHTRLPLMIRVTSHLAEPLLRICEHLAGRGQTV